MKSNHTRLVCVFSVIYFSCTHAGVTKQRSNDTKALLRKEAQFTEYTHKDLHQTKEAGKERLQSVLTGQHKLKEATNKYIKTE